MKESSSPRTAHVTACAFAPSHPIDAEPTLRLNASITSRVTTFIYGIVCYAIFVATFIYAFGWVANLGTPTALDQPPTDASPHWTTALVVNLGLLGLFAAQHSIMARPWFKSSWTQFVPEPAERSTYVLFSSVQLIVIFAFWQPMGGTIWNIDHPLFTAMMYAIMAVGWAIVFISTFLINHFDLFGLRQVWLFLLNRQYTHLPFRTPSLYLHVRHPLYLGWFIGFWATPTMTVAHLVFALATSIYILLAIRWEERDLVAHHGRRYAEYRKNVPMLIPTLNPCASQEANP